MDGREYESSPQDEAAEFKALERIINALRDLSPGARERVFSSAATFLQLAPPPTSPRRADTAASMSPSRSYPSFSDSVDLSAKEFLLEKQPKTDVERMTCLAFYLTHYADQPHFKTIDLSKLNTEAAQPKFSNAAAAVNNAVRGGYLVAATKGMRQISAGGEQFVQALPDRAAAREALAAATPRRKSPKPKRNAKKRTRSKSTDWGS